MIMEYNSFVKQLDELKTKITDKISDVENERLPIYDGPINSTKYFNSDIKVAWLLKEGYCSAGDGTGGNWSYSDADVYNRDDLYEGHLKQISSRATWYPIVYISYAILNGYKCYNDMDDLKDDPSMAQSMLDIAIVNAQKLPARQHTTTDMSDIVESINKYGDILKEQIDILNPDILIGGSTMKLYANMFELNDDERKTYGSINYWIKGGKLYIDAHHPSQRSINKFTYADDILVAVEEYFNSKLK